MFINFQVDRSCVYPCSLPQGFERKKDGGMEEVKK